jgi:hypothetical protein
VISGFDTTATVTVPEADAELVLLLPVPLDEPLDEQAATAATAATQPTAATTRGLNKEGLMNESPQ